MCDWKSLRKVGRTVKFSLAVRYHRSQSKLGSRDAPGQALNLGALRETENGSSFDDGSARVNRLKHRMAEFAAPSKVKCKVTLENHHCTSFVSTLDPISHGQSDIPHIRSLVRHVKAHQNRAAW